MTISAGIREPFTWNVVQASIRLGVNYAGLYDDLSLFSRALTDKEAEFLRSFSMGAAALRK